ncbi:40S ribosomal protein S19 [Salpingoeca rosetta]|uniref:40S ribosomal protein S19 n=1 Tax=Salpingoeca rosetta (strain ATCC 50818 / BSB-021) TaxID=946362 RepID=F2TVX0_SALR5|nr:40S ribosomal protein S19 [Salpingoeca rosetta]EGD72216.1 40S ribosomal protein S19 [Salpingoeca rosetta]|eukprot:XP_004998787.1 40S ribosomal protein S19 [Salpingoeca rosetta]
MPSATVKDVPADKLIHAYAALLKRQGKIKPPAWADYVKTAPFKELAPYDEDWFYVRCASIARHIYIRGGVGIGALRKVYGGSARRGTRPNHFKRGSGSVARKCVQALESVRVLAELESGGRVITPVGQKDLDRLATQIANTMQQEEE